MLGLGLAQLGIKFLVKLAPESLPRLNEITLDPIVLGFTLLVSVLAGVVFGVFPVLHSGAPVLVTALKEGGP